MGPLRLIATPIRRVANSRLFQLAIVVAIILLLDHFSYDYAVLRSLADGLKSLVTATVQLCSQFFRVGILTDPVLQVGLMIAYVYIICLSIFYLLGIALRAVVDHRWMEQFFVAKKDDCPGTRHCGLPRMGTVGEDQAGDHIAGKMGRDVCVARQQ